MLRLFVALISLVIAPASAFADTPEVTVLVVTSSRSFDGNLGRLQFTSRDGERFAEVMTTAGRTDPRRVVRLVDPTGEQVLQALGRINEGLRACRDCGSKFVFYYSGHADDRGLHLKDGALGKDQLHLLLGGVAAPTRIVLLDSCYSGALARKGVREAPAFELPKAEFDEPSGTIFLSASTGQENSYESKELGGSVFTYNLVAGLGGEGDANGDGIVTVDELYQYVYRETRLQSLMFPTVATQVPEFVSRLEGRGAVALSFPAEASGRLALDSDVAGQVVLTSRGGLRTYRVDKPFGTRKIIQIPTGSYSVNVSQGHRVGKREVVVEPRLVASLGGTTLQWTESVTTVRKGGEDESLMRPGFEAGAHGGYVANQIGGPIVGGYLTLPLVHLDTGTLRARVAAHGTKLAAREGDRWADGSDLALKAGLAHETTFAGAYAFTLHAGAGVAHQRLDWNGGDDPSLQTRITVPAFAVGATLLRSDVGLGVGRDFRVVDDLQTGRRVLAASSLFLTIQL